MELYKLNATLNNIELTIKYGRLYNWYAATDARSIAPVGWHVPTYDEFIVLINFVGGESVAAQKLSSESFGGSNEFNFNAIGNGGYYTDVPFFDGLDTEATFFTSTEENSSVAKSFWIIPSEFPIPLDSLDGKDRGLGIRLVKDNSINEGDVVIDGDTYNAVTIGTQVWLQQNLAVRQYRNGDPILSDFSGTVGAVCAYENSESNVYNSNTFTFDFLPENFEGVKISQNFSFVNPIGYTPKFSIDTMRVILNDKARLDNVFLTYGLESDVKIEILKLNDSATAYENPSYFAIDFESYVIDDDFSEFALKSISAIDYYNNIKNTEIQIALTADSNPIPNTQKFVNYVSLKNKNLIPNGDESYIFELEKNNESKIYDSDSALLGSDTYAYTFGESANCELVVSLSGQVLFNESFQTGSDAILLFKNIGGVSTQVAVLYSVPELGWQMGYTIPATNVVIPTASYEIGTSLTIELVTLRQSGTNAASALFFDIKKQTEKNVVLTNNEKIKYVKIGSVVNSIFNNHVVSSPGIFYYGLTSANSITKINDFAILKPKEFLSDLCIADGLMLNFKLDGSVYIGTITDMFNSLLNTSNAIDITKYKDLTIKYNTQLNFASVSVGSEINEYDLYTYPIDWNKILTFKQDGRNATENLDLTLSKFRTDFSGMLDYYYKRSQQKQKTSKDNFIFNTEFGGRVATVNYGTVFDWFTPRDILSGWEKFLSFCFQNFGKNNLTISSNGGSTDNLQISNVNQMDDYLLNSTPRLLPIEYEFTCLIDDIDFSEHILKINHDGVDVYLFVFKAETTDKLSEQKLNCLKIQF